MANDTDQWVDLWGSVQFEDRPENHRTVETKDGKTVLIHSIVVKSASTGQNVYVSFFDDAFPGFEHPGNKTPIWVSGKVRVNGEYVNVTADAYGLLPEVIHAKKRPKNEAF